MFTHPRFLPPSRLDGCNIRETIVAEGSILNAADIANSIIGIRSIVGTDVVLEETLVMGAD